MPFFSNTPTPIIPLPTRSEDESLSDGDLVDRLKAGLRVVEGEIQSLLAVPDRKKPLCTDVREQLLRTRRRVHDLKRMTSEQRIIRALDQGDRVADVWPVDLLGLVEAVSKPLAISYRLDYKPLCLETDENAVVSADPVLLRLALEALLICGLEHGLQNTPVMVYLARDASGSTATIHVVSKGCEEHDDRCPCLNHFEERMGSRLQFCSRVAQANRGWIAYDLQSSKSLDLSMTLPLVVERSLSVV